MLELLKVSEAAQRLRLSEAKVWALLASGELKSVRIGRARRIPASEVDAFIERAVAEAAREG